MFTLQKFTLLRATFGLFFYLPDAVEHRCAHYPEEAVLLRTVGALPFVPTWGGRRRKGWKKVSGLQHDVFVVLVTEDTVIERNRQSSLIISVLCVFNRHLALNYLLAEH